MKFDQVELDKLDITVIDGDRGKNYPHKDELLNTGYCLFLSANNVTKNGFEFSNIVYITKEKDAALHNGRLSRNDIVITTRGTVGNVGIYDETIKFEHMRINSGMLIVRCGQNIDNRFLYNVLRSKDFASQIDSIRTGSAQPQLPKSHFLKMVVPSIPLHFQRRIANILGALDDKIALNQQINKNLEEQAQAIYNDLFANVSFDAVLSDLGTIVGGSTPSKKHPEYYAEQGIAWITPKDLSNDSSKFIYHGENDITELGLSKCSASIMPTGTVLFSSRAPIGYIAIAANPVSTNQGFKSVIPNKDIGTAFIYCFLKNNLPMIESMASGSTFKEISASAMKTVPAFLPNEDSLKRFRDFCNPAFKYQQSLELENKRLANLRDALLPRLMSGEIDVSGIDV